MSAVAVVDNAATVVTLVDDDLAVRIPAMRAPVATAYADHVVHRHGDVTVIRFTAFDPLPVGRAS